MECLNISIKGIVQGVGFRPFIYNLANEMSLKGFVTNTSEGVVVVVEGEGLDNFLERIRKEAPPLSKIINIDIYPFEFRGFAEFTIKESSETGSFTLISPDISVCSNCLSEMLNKSDRRYLYPFINCTNCGPRYSITKSVPYDRANTTMSIFSMCKECESEYRNPSDRRFHAQPNACQDCGPSLKLEVINSNLKVKTETAPIEAAVDLLKQGAIIAVKGLGGFHIACDACNKDAVERLRERKRKSNKPFALMSPDIMTIKKFCHVSQQEESILSSHNKPIVLLKKLDNLSLPDAVAPNNGYLGFMLPYTPLHYLLFYYPVSRDQSIYKSNFDALIMTSGNLSEEPIVTGNEEAVSKLSGITDAFLFHNRDIFMRVDDSVIKIRDKKFEIGNETKDQWYLNNSSRFPSANSHFSFIRRSRGFTPQPILLNEEGPIVLGCGADLKNTFTITKGSYAIQSQHIGNMENYETIKFFKETLDNLKKVYRAEPEAIAYDLHPNYMSTQWALSQCQKTKAEEQKSEDIFHISNFNSQIKCYGVQHHYAHIASVMAEKGIKGKVIGVSFDGSGYGEDGNLWGGEFLIADIIGFKRAGHIRYTPLPGGESAIKEPWKIAVSYLKEAAGNEFIDYMDASFIKKYGKDMIDKISAIHENRKFSPLSSGAGRLFDAVSSILGICDKNTFEGEAAIALESLVLDDINEDYPVNIIFNDPMEIDFSPAFLKIANEVKTNLNKKVISTRFHNTVVSAVIRVVLKLSLESNLRKVVLSGGVFQNSYLLNKVITGLTAEGISVYVNELVPCNDAGISLGQAYIIRERLKEGII